MAGKMLRPGIPDLVKYLERPRGRPVRKYITYEEGARLYKMPYWSFVRMAKRGEAAFPIRKTAVVDRDILDEYLEGNLAELVEIFRSRRYLK